MFMFRANYFSRVNNHFAKRAVYMFNTLFHTRTHASEAKRNYSGPGLGNIEISGPSFHHSTNGQCLSLIIIREGSLVRSLTRSPSTHRTSACQVVIAITFFGCFFFGAKNISPETKGLKVELGEMMLRSCSVCCMLLSRRLTKRSEREASLKVGNPWNTSSEPPAWISKH